MFDALYSQNSKSESLKEMAKTTAPAKREKDEANILVYTDVNGNVVELDVTKDTVALGELDWFQEAQSIFPGVEQCFYGRPDRETDDKGRPNIINENFLILEAFRTDVNSQYGYYFIIHAANRERGRFSFASGGKVVNEELEQIVGVELATGRKLTDAARSLKENWGKPETPVWASIEFIPDAGQYKDGYYVLVPPFESLSVEEPEAVSAD